MFTVIVVGVSVALALAFAPFVEKHFLNEEVDTNRSLDDDF